MRPRVATGPVLAPVDPMGEIRGDFALGSFIGAAIMTIYFTAGGLLGTAWVNSVQLVIMLVGFLVALPERLGPECVGHAWRIGVRAAVVRTVHGDDVSRDRRGPVW